MQVGESKQVMSIESLEVRQHGNILATESVKEPFFRKHLLSFTSCYLKLWVALTVGGLHTATHSFSTADTR